MEEYTNISYISGGTSGKVWKAENLIGESVAIKLIDLKYPTGDKYKRLYREICILKHLDSQFCLSLLDSFAKYENGNLIQVYLVFPFMEYDLHKMILDYKLTYHQIITIIYQLLLGLEYLAKSGIIHRDIKPSNIGINRNMTLRILDFGLARDKQDDLTEYVVTRWYRPLEIFCVAQYTTAVDIWSAGCIMAELFTQKALFPGKSQHDQCICILSVMGWPSDEMLNKIGNPDTVLGLQLFKSCAAESNQLVKLLEKPVKIKINSCSPESEIYCNDVLTLISQMLDLDPEKRISSLNALSSPVFLRESTLSQFVESGTPRTFQCLKLSNTETDNFWTDKIIKEIEN